MTDWACAIARCGSQFDSVEDLIRHQVTDHGRCTCAVCGEAHPEGYLAIRHAFTEHTRADYVRAYDASSDDIRLRERLMEVVEDRVDVPALLSGLDVEVDGEDAAVSAGD